MAVCEGVWGGDFLGGQSARVSLGGAVGKCVFLKVLPKRFGLQRCIALSGSEPGLGKHLARRVDAQPLRYTAPPEPPTPALQVQCCTTGLKTGGAVMKKKKLGVSNTPYGGGRWATDGGWWVTDGGLWVTDGGWWVTDGGLWVTDGGLWVATIRDKHQRVDAIVKKKGGGGASLWHPLLKRLGCTRSAK